MKSKTKEHDHKLGAKSALLQLVNEKIASSGKTQGEIAVECGFPRSNILSMIKHGYTKLPVDRLPRLAKSLEIDPSYMMRMYLTEHDPGLLTILNMHMGGMPTRNEIRLLTRMRSMVDGDPDIDEDLVESLCKDVQARLAPRKSGLTVHD